MYNENYRHNAYRRVKVTQYRSRMRVEYQTIAESFSYLFIHRNIIAYPNVYVDTVAATGDTATDCNALEQCSDDNYNIRLICTSKHAASVEAMQARLTALGYILSPCENMLKVSEEHKVALYYKGKQNYIIISNLMSADIWHRIGTVVGIITEKLPEDEIENWRVGNFEHLAEKIKNEMKAEQDIEYNKTVLRLVNEAEEKLSKNPLQHLKVEYENVKTRIDALEDELRTLYNDLKRVRKDMVFAKFEMAKEEKESMIEIFKSFRKHIKSLEINENRSGHNWLRIIAETDVMFFDEDSAKNLKRSTRTNVFNSGNINTQWVLNEIFILKKAKLHVVSGAEISLTNGSIQKIGNYTHDYLVHDEAGFRNPHHDRYNCWGDYTRTITQAACDGRYEMLIQTVLTAIAGINVIDTPVMEELARKIQIAWDVEEVKAVNYKGNLYSFKEYYRLRHEEEEEECTELD